MAPRTHNCARAQHAIRGETAQTKLRLGLLLARGVHGKDVPLGRPCTFIIARSMLPVACEAPETHLNSALPGAGEGI
jgi:hypothetical protein